MEEAYYIYLTMGDKILESVNSHTIEFCDEIEESDIAYRVDKNDTTTQIKNGLHYLQEALVDLKKLGVTPTIKIAKMAPLETTITEDSLYEIASFEQAVEVFDND